MKEGPDIARIASLVGDPARANMLTALMTGKALTASELASEAGITAPTASSHLRKLSDGQLIRVRQQGRHRYYALADDRVARSLEALMDLAAGTGHVRTRTGPRDHALREARVCYNHLAGQMATRLFDRLAAQRYLGFTRDGLALTADGTAFFAQLGIDLAQLSTQRGPLCRECLDWSERRSHLAGSLGRALLTTILARGWATRDPGSRAVLFSPKGRAAFEQLVPQG
mgnify:CR=1 FL=1